MCYTQLIMLDSKPEYAIITNCTIQSSTLFHSLMYNGHFLHMLFKVYKYFVTFHVFSRLLDNKLEKTSVPSIAQKYIMHYANIKPVQALHLLVLINRCCIVNEPI